MSSALDILSGNGGTTVMPPTPSLASTGSNPTIGVLPYNALTDPLGDVFLYGLWDRMRKEGLMDIFFHEDPGMPFAKFVRQFVPAEGELVLMIVQRDSNDTVVDHLGFAMLNGVVLTEAVHRGIAHFCFFERFWNGRDSVAGAKAVLNHFFNVCGMDVLVGIIPKPNRPALAFIHRLGWQTVGEIPGATVFKGQRCASVINYLGREDWHG